MELLNSASTSLRAVSGRLGLSSSAPTGTRKLCRQAGSRIIDPKTRQDHKHKERATPASTSTREPKQMWFKSTAHPYPIDRFNQKALRSMRRPMGCIELCFRPPRPVLSRHTLSFITWE